MAATSVLCRDCGALASIEQPTSMPGRCRDCGSPRLLAHPELADLAIAHLDCDAFYATVEKRVRPELAEQPVIVGGGTRGVVLACCYVARLYGVRSAMPMFKALAACPDAVVIRPDMAKYREVGRAVRVEMRSLTPLVEPLSIDEAFLDLSGTASVHGAAPAQLLAALARRVETSLAVTVSIGLSYNKFLAKLASDLDKPRGFAVIAGPRRPSFSPTSRSAGCGGWAARCSGALPPTGSCGSGSCARSIRATWRSVTAGSERGWRSWRRARTGAASIPRAAPARSRPRRPLRRTRPARRRWRRPCGRYASGSRRGSSRAGSPPAP
jgi:DNA polymerase-4